MAKKLKRLVEQLEQRITAIERALASSRVTDAFSDAPAPSEAEKHRYSRPEALIKPRST
jgi:hypothetical protein